jgi:hypothetical protein
MGLVYGQVMERAWAAQEAYPAVRVPEAWAVQDMVLAEVAVEVEDREIYRYRD